MKKSDMLEAASTIYDYLARGKRDVYIMEKMGLDSETYDEIKKLMLETKAESIRTQPREHYFIEYQIEQRRGIKDLDDLIRNLDANSQYNALIGAIRLRSDIVDKIVNRAQEFGLVRKEAERKEMIGGFIIAQLGAEDLRKEIIAQTKLMGDVMGKYGEKDFMALPPAPLHFGPSINVTGESVTEDDEASLDDDEEPVLPAPKMIRPTGPRAKTAKRSAGRKRTR